MQLATQTATKIVLNMQPIEVHQDGLSYEQLARLAYPGDPVDAPEIVYTITLSHPELGDISLGKGDKSVPVKEGMVCHVRKTGRS